MTKNTEIQNILKTVFRTRGMIQYNPGKRGARNTLFICLTSSQQVLFHSGIFQALSAAREMDMTWKHNVFVFSIKV